MRGIHNCFEELVYFILYPKNNEIRYVQQGKAALVGWSEHSVVSL